MNKIEFNKLFHGLCLSFGFEGNDEIRDVYYGFLKEVPDDRIKTAINGAIKTCKFFPKISELIELSTDLNPGVLWSRVIGVASRGGMGYETLTDYECEIVCEMGGMNVFQDSTEEGLPFLRKEFEAKAKDLVGLKCPEYPITDRPRKLGFAPGSIVMLKHRDWIVDNELAKIANTIKEIEPKEAVK